MPSVEWMKISWAMNFVSLRIKMVIFFFWVSVDQTGLLSGASFKRGIFSSQSEWDCDMVSMVTRGMLSNVFDRQQFPQLANWWCGRQAAKGVGNQSLNHCNNRCQWLLWSLAFPWRLRCANLSPVCHQLLPQCSEIECCCSIRRWFRATITSSG